MRVGRVQIALCIAAAAFCAAIATPAQAGLEFTDTVTAGGGIGSPGVRFNGVDAATFGSLSIPAGFAAPGTNRVLVTAPSAVFPTPQFAVLNFSYSTGAPTYDSVGTWDLVIQMGDIVIDPVFGSLTLSTVAFSENGGSSFSPSYGINQTWTANESGTRLFYQIPDAVVPPTTRDAVNVVQLTFVVFGSATSFGVNAVANPEPGTMALFGLGALGLVGLVRRRRKTRLLAAADAA